MHNDLNDLGEALLKEFPNACDFKCRAHYQAQCYVGPEVVRLERQLVGNAIRVTVHNQCDPVCETPEQAATKARSFLEMYFARFQRQLAK